MPNDEISDLELPSDFGFRLRTSDFLSAAAVCSREDPATFVEEDALKVHLQRLRIRGFGESFLFRDLAIFHELKKGLVKIEHAIVSAGFDGGSELVEPVFLDQFFDRGGID